MTRQLPDLRDNRVLMILGLLLWLGLNLAWLFLLGFLLPAYTIAGFDGSAHTSEETIGAAYHVPRGIVRMLESLGRVYTGFGVSQLHHALQTATMARKANASDEMVLASLCHDLGKAISIAGHGEISAAILQPSARDRSQGNHPGLESRDPRRQS